MWALTVCHGICLASSSAVQYCLKVQHQLLKRNLHAYVYSSPFAAFTIPTIKPITIPTGTNIPANIKLVITADLIAAGEQLVAVKVTKKSPTTGPIHNPFNVYFPIVFALLILTPSFISLAASHLVCRHRDPTLADSNDGPHAERRALHSSCVVKTNGRRPNDRIAFGGPPVDERPACSQCSRRSAPPTVM